MKRSASYWLQQLGLSPHIEGGAFREVYRSPLHIPRSALPETFASGRPVATSIYFLLTASGFSAFHRIRSDETWHFYEGETLLIHELTTTGKLVTHQLGRDPEQGEQFQCTITAGHWFAARLAPGGEYALCGCTVAPGFDFEDFELARRAELIQQYPQHETLITALTYP